MWSWINRFYQLILPKSVRYFVQFIIPWHAHQCYFPGTNVRRQSRPDWRRFLTGSVCWKFHSLNFQIYFILIDPRFQYNLISNLIDPWTILHSAGHMQASQALDLIQYLVKETDFLPWKVALAQLQFVMVHIQVKWINYTIIHVLLSIGTYSLNTIRWLL